MNSQVELMRALEMLGEVLKDRSVRYHVIIAGGSALLLAGEARRPTQDVDVVALAVEGQPLRSNWRLPEELTRAVRDVASTLGLAPDWLNAGAVAVVGDDLPDGYRDRLRTVGFGNLTVSVLGRLDLLALKVLAAFDEGAASRHMQDIRSMRPSTDELHAAYSWAAGRRHPEDPLVANIANVLGLAP